MNPSTRLNIPIDCDCPELFYQVDIQNVPLAGQKFPEGQMLAFRMLDNGDDWLFRGNYECYNNCVIMDPEKQFLDLFQDKL